MQNRASLACLSAVAVKINLLLKITWSPVSLVGRAFKLNNAGSALLLLLGIFIHWLPCKEGYTHSSL